VIDVEVTNRARNGHTRAVTRNGEVLDVVSETLQRLRACRAGETRDACALGKGKPVDNFARRKKCGEVHRRVGAGTLGRAIGAIAFV
jgi:hypothetical protein